MARELVENWLPDWAESKARTDREGNLILEVGPDRDPVMFIAHLDEVGFEVTNIAPDGIVPYDRVADSFRHFGRDSLHAFTWISLTVRCREYLSRAKAQLRNSRRR